MGNLVVSDNAATTLAASISNSPSVSSITVSNGAKFPMVNHGGSGSDWSYVTLFDAAGNIETMKVTRHDNGSGSMSVVRGTAAGISGVNDASCLAWASGTTGVACRMIAQTVSDLFSALASAQAAAVAAAASAAQAAIDAASAPNTAAEIVATLGSEPVEIAGTVSTGGISSADKLADHVVTLVKMAAMATARLLGRSTAGSGSPEEIEIGSGLSLSSGVLSATGGGVTGSFRNLQASANGISANVSVTADELVVANASGVQKLLQSLNLTINTATVGANGLDTGTLAGSTWYALFSIAKDDGTKAGLISLSATAPTLPSGYTHKARVGWIRTDGTANKYPLSFKQYGRNVQYAAVAGSNVPTLPTITSGIAGTVTSTSITWVAVGVSSFVPASAVGIKVVLSNGGGNYSHVAPNNTFGGQSHSSNPSPVNCANGTALVLSGEFALESSNIYYAANAAQCFVNCMGWEDNL